VTLEPVHVICVKAVGGTKGADEAFKRLESKIPTMRGRRFYGTFNPFTDECRVCVQVREEEDAESMGLEDWTIPGGMYARQRVMDWNSKLPELPQIFMKFAEGKKVDRSRPSVELYRSQKELIIFLPVLE